MKKTVKIIVAAAMLACVTAAFFGFDTDLACRIQPAATVWFLAVLLLTPLFGRLFCECLCPLGIIQSIVNWIFHPKTKVRRVCTRIPETKAQQTVRWTVLAVVAVLIATGFGAVGWFLTPYSIYGKTLVSPSLRSSWCSRRSGRAASGATGFALSELFSAFSPRKASAPTR